MNLKVFNINDDVYVKLTPQGLVYYNLHPLGCCNLRKSGEYYKMELWVFMKIFSPLVNMGCNIGAYFDLNIAFRKEDLQ